MIPDKFLIHGLAPSEILVPSNVEEAAEVVRKSVGKTIIPWGGGTQQQVGYSPSRFDSVLLTQNLNKIIEYNPADLTITVQAGVTIASLQSILNAQGQWLPLDIALPEVQTVGGVVATRANNLTRASNGSVRDYLLGVHVIDGTGECITGGGKVVKNVSGYDLPKLYCGSWGTLGLITQASFKVAPLPESQATVLIPLPNNRNAEEILDYLLQSDLELSFLFLLNSRAAKMMLSQSEESQYLAVGLDGIEEDIRWQLNLLGTQEADKETSHNARSFLRDFPAVSTSLFAEFHILSSQVGAFSRMVEWTAARFGFESMVVADTTTGIVYAHITPGEERVDWLALYPDFIDKAARVGGSYIIRAMPEEWRQNNASPWFPILDDFQLMEKIKSTLDPQKMWNPGRFIGRL